MKRDPRPVVTVVWDSWIEEVPKVQKRGFASFWREQKMAAHLTRGGKGEVARAMKK